MVSLSKWRLLVVFLKVGLENQNRDRVTILRGVMGENGDFVAFWSRRFFRRSITLLKFRIFRLSAF